MENPNSRRSMALQRLEEDAQERVEDMKVVDFRESLPDGEWQKLDKIIEAQVERLVDRAIGDADYDCPNGGDGPDD